MKTLRAILLLIAPVAVMAQQPPLPGMEGPGGVPHYFGPYGNWAYSPLPRGAIGAITVDVGGTGYTAPTVAIRDAFGTGDGTATATIDPLTQIDPATGAILGITVTTAGSGYSAPVVSITDGNGAGAAASAELTALVGGMRKFVDRLPGQTPAGANALGQYIPIAVPETRIVSGQTVDYYEIALVEFTERMHSDLPPTRLRGYVQLATAAVPGAGVALTQPGGAPILKPDGTPAIGVDGPHYLGPTIVAKGRAHGVASPDGDPRPVRIKFYNLLPAGAGGNLFLPVDETVMGSGMGPSVPGQAGDKYSQNRGVIHLHGNNTVWISDGTPHQWITPADEVTPYPKGVSTRNVPDMLDAGGNVDCDVAPAGKNSSGCQTFYYTNAQSARLQFYHDHSLGITRLNVYAGEAAGYVLTDAVEQDLINGTNLSGVNPGLLKVLPDMGIPLVIQDRTFVDAATVFTQDPTWNSGTGPRRSGHREPHGRGHGRPLVPARLHVRAESVGPRRRQCLRPLALWSLVQSARPRVRQRRPRGMHRDGAHDERVPPGRLRPGPTGSRLHRALGAADEAWGAQPLHGRGGLHGHAGRQRRRLPVPGGGA